MCICAYIHDRTQAYYSRFSRTEQRGDDRLLGGDGNDWLYGDYARQAAQVDTDLPVIAEVMRVMTADATSGLAPPGPLGTLVQSPMVLLPNEAQELSFMHRSFSATAGTVLLPGVLKDMRNLPQVGAAWLHTGGGCTHLTRSHAHPTGLPGQHGSHGHHPAGDPTSPRRV